VTIYLGRVSLADTTDTFIAIFAIAGLLVKTIIIADLFILVGAPIIIPAIFGGVLAGTLLETGRVGTCCTVETPIARQTDTVVASTTLASVWDVAAARRESCSIRACDTVETTIARFADTVVARTPSTRGRRIICQHHTRKSHDRQGDNEKTGLKKRHHGDG
jgi:hypothetical protein